MDWNEAIRQLYPPGKLSQEKSEKEKVVVHIVFCDNGVSEVFDSEQKAKEYIKDQRLNDSPYDWCYLPFEVK